jgi:hypothetical protein
VSGSCAGFSAIAFSILCQDEQYNRHSILSHPHPRSWEFSIRFFFFEAPHEGFLIQLGLAFSSGALILVLELEVTATLNTELWALVLLLS